MATQSFQLVMDVGPTPGKAIPLNKPELVIGRESGCDIVINIAEVSRRHARLRSEAGGYIVEDLGSTNGTFVNGQRISGPVALRPGDRIQLGDAVTLAYQVEQYDMNATVVSPAGRQPATQPPRPPVAPPAQPPAAPPPPPQPPAYVGSVPASPPAAAARPQSRTWLWATLGCLGVLVCAVIIGAVAFDAMNLYCVPPFDSLFSFLYTCP